MDSIKRDMLEKALNEALDEFSLNMNQNNTEFSRLGYNEDAILIMDAIGKQTHELAASFRDAILKALS